MYENGKMRSDTIPGMGEGGIKENNGGGEFTYGILQALLQMSQCTPCKIII
jgi:hypothetical protein